MAGQINYETNTAIVWRDEVYIVPKEVKFSGERLYKTLGKFDPETGELSYFGGGTADRTTNISNYPTIDEFKS